MKLKRPSLIFPAAVVAAMFFTGCATLFSGKTTEVVLVDYTPGLKVYQDGQQLPVVQVKSHQRSRPDASVVEYFTGGVKVNKKKKHQTLTLEQDGKKANVDIKLKASGAFVVLDLFTTGPLGIGIDAATKKWRIVKNKHIDVPAVLDGKESRSQRRLKKVIKKKAEANS